MRRTAPRALLVLLVAAALAAGACSRKAPTAPSVDPTSQRGLPAGEVVGFTGAYGSHAWKGLPYAAPPVGELRWRAPRPAPRWKGVRKALASGQACPQYASVFSGAKRGDTGVVGGEDCLYLDVYAPRFEPDAVPAGDTRLPVLFWIHGGGNSIGRAGFYNGGNLAATHHVVVVAINYRLGPFGWFRHASLRGDDTTALDRSGDFGTLDMIRALEWVHDNVSAFGGDPGNVTIFGESAGGRNVYQLLVSSLAQGLFQRAMVESGGLYSATLAEAENWSDADEPGAPHSSNEILARLMVKDGGAPDRAAAEARIEQMDAPLLAAYLRGKRPEELLAAYADDGSAFGGMLDFPQVFSDGAVLPVEPSLDRLAEGAYNRVPVILGTNRDENKLFMAFDPELSHWRFGLFPQPNDAERYDAQAEVLAHGWKARAVDEPARRMRAVQGPTVFAYRWDWDEEPSIPFLYDGTKMIGAAHGLEIAFFFGHWDMGPETGRLFRSSNREGREALSAQMMSYLAQFAYTGAPGRGRAGDLPEWKPWDDSGPEAPKYVVLDTPDGGGVRMASETWTVERVVAEALADPRLTRPRDRCALLRQMTRSGYLSRDEYATVGDGVCAAFAYEAYPWTDVSAAGG